MKKTISNLKNKKADSNVNQSQVSTKYDNSPMNIKKLVNPVEFETVYFHNKNGISNDPNRVLVKIPDKDVEINRVARKQTVFNNGVPTNIQDIYSNSLLVKLSIDFYTSEWLVTCYKDFSYNCAFWCLPNIHSQLSTVKERKFLIDEEKEKDNESLLAFKTKGNYFESQLAVCGHDEYTKYVKYREDELANVNVSSTGANNSKSAIPKMISFSLSELSDGMKVLKESMPGDRPFQVILYLDVVDSIREIGDYWIHLALKGKQKGSYLYAGGKENQKLWLANLKGAIETTTAKGEGTGSQDSLERIEETAQGMLAKILQESEQSAAALRKKDHQKILAISLDVREHIKKKSKPAPFYETGLIEKTMFDDSSIRPQVQQTVQRRYFKLTAQKFLTGIQIPQENSGNRDSKTLPEPFFISCCLIHIGEGRRISEEFQWNPNHPNIENLLPQELFVNKWGPSHTSSENGEALCNMTPLDLPTFSSNALQNCKSFLVKTAYPREQIGILIKIDKVFNGIMSAAVDKYIKYRGIVVKKTDGENDVITLENGDIKTGLSLYKSISTFCANIGNYRMPFCWSIGRLSVDGSLKLKLYKYDGTKTSDDDLMKQVHSVNFESTGKITSIPGYIEVTVEEVAEDAINDMADLVNSELICKIKSNPSDQSGCCKEIKEFIFDPLRPINTYQTNHLKNAQSLDVASSTTGSKSNSNYGSSLSLHYSDDNSPGDVTPPGDAYFANPYAKSMSYTKTFSASLGRISGNDVSQLLSSKSLDIPDPVVNYQSAINQEDLVAPFLDFSHCLYLYPRALNFSNQSSFHRARNLSCFVELRDSDKLDSSIPLKVIYTRANNKQPAFDSWANTSVVYHDSSPTFNEEIKIALPIKLHARHHLLFRFYHVSCDTASISNVRDKASNKKHIETQVGYAWLPLLDSNLNLQNGTFHLPVATNLIADYLDDKNQTNHIQWVDGQKPLFNVVLKPESTIYTSNLHLHKFFRVCTEKLDIILVNGVEKTEVPGLKHRNGNDAIEPSGDGQGPVFSTPSNDIVIKNAIKSLGTVTATNLIPFLGQTFNQLFIIIVSTCTSFPEMSQTATITIINLSSTLRGQYLEPLSQRAIKRNTKILKNYIKYSFDADKIVPARSKKTVHECLVQTISDLIRPPFRDTNLMLSFLHNSFLLYSIIVKSMIQSSSKQTKIIMDRSGDKVFTSTFMTSVENMVHLVISCILEVSNNHNNQQQQSISGPQRNQTSSTQPLASAANKDLARFISRLLNIMDRGFVFLRIYQYMHIINQRIENPVYDRDHLSRMKFEFLEIICQHEHFLPLNLISLVNQADKAPPMPEMLLTETFCQQHYLVGLVLQQVHQQMCDVYSSTATRRIPFVLLRNMLAKHIFDDRYNNNTIQQARIAALYLPFVAIVLENQRALCMPGTSYSRKTIIQNINDHTDRSLSSRPLSAFSSDTISTHSSINGSGSEGAGGSVYGVSFGACNNKSSRSSQVYLDKEGHVEPHFLNMIAGLNTDGGLINLATRRHVDSDSSSVHSTSTLIGLEEMNEKEETTSLGDEMIVRTKTEIYDQSNKRASLQRLSQSNNSSLGKKAGMSLAFNMKKNTATSTVNPRISSRLGATNTNKTPEVKSSIYLNEKTQKDVFTCLMHIFSTVSAEDMKITICNLTVQERAEFLQLMIYAIHHLKYQGKKVINNFESISKGKYHGLVQLRSNAQKGSASDMVDDIDQGNNKAILEGNVSTEVGLIVLDVLSVYCNAYKQEILTYTPDHAIFRRIIDVYLTLLVVNQSDTVLRHVLVSMRVFVATFAKVIFSSCHSVICDLSLHVLRYCDSLSSAVRIEACGFLYRMMRCSYDTFNKPGFNRVHLQMIVAVSKLDRTVGRRFNKSLNFLRRLAELEMQKTQTNASAKSRPNTQTKSTGVHSSTKTSMQLFFDEVSDLTHRIRTVLMATVQMNEHKDDPEMLVDLQYSLAKSYSSNPALRRTWLEKIYAVHEKSNSKAEMAMCKAHIVAMIAEYLKRKESEAELYSIGCANFKSVSPNIPNEESGMRDDSTQLEVHYTKEEVIQLLRDVAQEFDSAGLWEVLRHIYKLVIPIYEKKRDYEQLAQIYQHLSAAYIKIKNSEATNQRLIGSYYRVVLYGKPFESLAGKVFIYRLDSGKQFCVAREELQKLFEKKYGAENVQMLIENHVNRGKLDPELASIQVTHVDPFFGEEEELERQSMFESQYNISKFFLETPFVKKAHDDNDGILRSKQTDDLSLQWKRRTILTVEAYFPHLKRRLEVISTKEIDFSPIERAIDEIKSKNRQLITHLAFSKQSADDNKSSSSSTVSGSVPSNNSHSGNINLLMDMHLTGALLPQVNQGPMAYARVFLHKESPVNFPIEMVKQLKIQFMEFLSLCHMLLNDYYELMSHVHEPKYQAMRVALDKYRLELCNLLKEEVVVDEEKVVISTGQLADSIKKDLVKRLGTCDSN